jgi:hypothetical protein
MKTSAPARGVEAPEKVALGWESQGDFSVSGDSLLRKHMV